MWVISKKSITFAVEKLSYQDKLTCQPSNHPQIINSNRIKNVNIYWQHRRENR